ncbi:Crp/Fnr family transcriptional regulator [Listeria costaricensis]|uniref:Crp/Fnr family transcriptional regulator n=1 Tax=Listeria costaricensis TaxID=2026604 RepID=UPI0013C43FD6|nr:Crp/Fnr family transcriptional regulator [Listeria costaricensis]
MSEETFLPQREWCPMSEHEFFKSLVAERKLKMRTEIYKNKGFLNEDADFVQNIYYVQEGLVIASYKDKATHCFIPGEFIDLSYLLMEEEYPFLCEVKQNSQIVVFKKAELIDLMVSKDLADFFVDRSLESNMHRLYEQFYILQSVAEHDLEKALYHFAKRYATPKKDYLEFPLGLSKQVLQDCFYISKNLFEKLQKNISLDIVWKDGRKSALQVAYNGVDKSKETWFDNEANPFLK